MLERRAYVLHLIRIITNLYNDTATIVIHTGWVAGHIKALSGFVKYVAPECKFTLCGLHRETLIAKSRPVDLQSVLNESVKTVYQISTASV